MAAPGSILNTNATNKIALINEYMTAPPAEAVLEKSGLLTASPDDVGPLKLLDNASGIGTLIFRLLKHNPQLEFDALIAGDIDETYLAFARERASENGAPSAFEARKLNQQAPGLEDASFDFIFNNLGVFFGPNDTAVLSETHRMLKVGGTAGFTSWQKLTWWDEILVPALARYLPDAPTLPYPTLIFPSKGWDDPAQTRAKLEEAGFVDVQAETYSFVPEISTEDLTTACTLLVKVISARAWDADAKARFEPHIQKAFHDYLHESFEGGKWTGKMIAVLTLGKKA